LNAEAGNTKAKLAEHDSNAQQQAVQIEKLETQSREAQEQIAEGHGRLKEKAARISELEELLRRLSSRPRSAMHS